MITIIKKGPDTCFFSDGIQLARAVGKEGWLDSFEEKAPGVYRWIRRLPASEAGNKGTAKMRMELRASYLPDFTMVPGVNYDGNGWGTFCEYTSDRYHGVPWTYGWHRSSVAAMTYSEKTLAGRTVSVALFGKEEGGNSCQLYSDREEEVHSLVWPETEAPRTLFLYRFGPAWQGEEKEMDSFTAWIVLEEDAVPRSGYRKALDAAWEQNDRKRDCPYPPERIWELGIAYAKQLYTKEPDGFCGINIGLAWENGGWEKRKYNKYEIGWCGQNAMFANALLGEALRTGDKEAKAMGFSVLDSWLEMARVPAGVTGSYYDPGQVRYLEACDLGTAGLAYFEACDLTEKLSGRILCGEGKKAQQTDSADPARIRQKAARYYEAALEICDFAVRMQGEDGSFAKCWHADGRTAIKDGTVGAFLVMPLIEGYRRTGKESYKEAAVKGLRRYLKELKEYGYTTAGALDIFSIDKESGIPLLKGAMALYELTGEKEWLDGALDSAWYLSTWQYTHTCHFGPELVLGRTGYDSFGGTLVSTVHEGIDPFALCYIPELYQLFKATGQERWLKRARAVWRNGCQHISDGSLVIDGRLRPEGSQDESYTVTRQGKRGIASGWLVAWPGSFRMEALRRLKNEKDAASLWS